MTGFRVIRTVRIGVGPDDRSAKLGFHTDVEFLENRTAALIILQIIQIDEYGVEAIAIETFVKSSCAL